MLVKNSQSNFLWENLFQLSKVTFTLFESSFSTLVDGVLPLLSFPDGLLSLDVSVWYISSPVFTLGSLATWNLLEFGLEP